MNYMFTEIRPADPRHRADRVLREIPGPGRASELPELPPPVQPAENPFPNTVAGAGMVEPETENISVGSPVPGIVVEVMVKVGQKVKAGDPLFRLDDRELKAELAVRKAMLADAKAELARLEAMPRPEELPAAEARCARRRPTGRTGSSSGPAARSCVTQRAISEEEFYRAQAVGHRRPASDTTARWPTTTC